MGLDMYLTGERFFTSFGGYVRPKRGKFDVKSEQLDLGYWRKFADLHGFIVEAFADDVDECQTIELSVEDMEKIIEALEGDYLPHTEGFFFRYDADEEHWAQQRAEAVATFKDAIEWLKADDPGVWKHVEYRASW